MSYTPTILIADDEPLGQETLRVLLQPQGYRLYFASNGAEALEQAVVYLPDLILLDVMMPEMDGFEVCRQLRANPILREAPLIMVTALDDRVSRLQGIEAGADDFISKPFDRTELRARVRTITRLNRYRRLLAERARFEWVIEHADDGYLIVAEAGNILYANPQAQRYLGVEPDSNLIETMFLDLVYKQYRCNPPDEWATWITQIDTQPTTPHYLLRLPSSNAELFMLQADVLDAASYPTDGYVIRLRDITASVANQNAVWSFQGLVRHKLSTALTQVVGSLQVLKSMNLAPAEGSAAELFEIATHSSRQLKEQLQNIFRYMDSSDLIHPQNEHCNVAELVQLMSETCVDFGLLTTCIRYEKSKNVNNRLLAISRTGIELVLRELVENACKFHPLHTPAIEIILTIDYNDLRIAVSDDGLTLSHNQLANAWVPYYQGEHYFTIQQAGMGLGLPMVATLIWRIGGSCRISNREPGPGVRVDIVVPLVEDDNSFIDELFGDTPVATLLCKGFVNKH